MLLIYELYKNKDDKGKGVYGICVKGKSDYVCICACQNKDTSAQYLDTTCSRSQYPARDPITRRLRYNGLIQESSFEKHR